MPTRLSTTIVVWLVASLIFAMTAVAWSTPSWAGQWQVAPLRVELSNQKSTAALSVANRSDRPATLHVRAYAWSQSDGEDRLDETDALIVSPPIFTVAGNREQTVRVGLRRVEADDASPARERSYRIVIEEVPDDGPDAQGVRLVLRMSLPVFVRADARVPVQAHLAWTLVRADANGWRLEAANDGAAHAQVVSLRVHGSDADKPIASIDTPVYVLPGASKRWELGAAAVTPGRALRIEAQTRTERIDASVVPAP